MTDVNISKIKGTTKIDAIHFRDKENSNPDKMYTKEGIVERYIKPDVVICENGLGKPKIDLNKFIYHKETGSLSRLGIDETTGIPSSNMNFSLLYNDIQSPIYAAGSCT